ncbi:hypothetical protein [Kitasatospora sp. NPDC004289]
MGPEPGSATALELEKLRGELSTGFAEIKGSLQLLVQRSDQTDRSLGEHRVELVDLDKRLAALEQARAADAELGQESRLRSLEASRWPLASAGGLVGLAGLALGVYSNFSR